MVMKARAKASKRLRSVGSNAPDISCDVTLVGSRKSPNSPSVISIVNAPPRSVSHFLNAEIKSNCAMLKAP